jgi:delta14-sterol reductase
MKTTTQTKKKEPFPYEFGGPIGCAASVLLLPPLVMILSHWSRVGYVDLASLTKWESLSSIILFKPTANLYVLAACGAGLVSWFLGLALLWAVLPGQVVQGAPVVQAITKKDVLRLSYKLNGHLSFWVVVALLVVVRPNLNDVLFRYLDELAWMANLWTMLLSIYFYVGSFRPGRILSFVGNSGNHFHDFWMGRELNPRLSLPSILSPLQLDWKQFCELRPGLILWMLLNLACLQEQYQVLGYVTPSMLLINGLQAFYVWDALYQERAILTTMDITTDGFGFMLCFGDLAWVPFTYTVPAKFLVHHDPHLSTLVLLAILALYLFGFYIFRSANGQKDAFRRNPNHPSVAHLSYLQTKRGTRLLTSGWWGLARKVNYTGDWIMGLTYSLLCGFDSLVPYYYAVYFAVLLIHRSTRDDDLCHQKYGDDWIEYKRQVPYRFIPGII